MNISDVVNITEGVLANIPKVQSVNSVSVYPSKIEQGDLFISSNQEDIDSAIENGAYAIIYDDEAITKKDTEIAWIKVSDISLAAMKIIRYVLLKREADLYLLTPYELSFLKFIALEKRNITILSNTWQKAFEQILNTNNHLIVGTQTEWFLLISSDLKQLKEEINGEILLGTLFRSTFKVDGFVYQNYELPPFHLSSLLRTIGFCQQHNIPYAIEKVRYTKHFIPIFVDKNLNPVTNGKSEKVIIFSDNLEDIEAAREYIKYRARWAKSIVLTPPKTKIDKIDKPIWFETNDEIRLLLQQHHFNYAFVYKADKSILNQLQQEQRLFN